MNLKKQFSKAYDKHAEKIFRFVFLKVGTQEAAEDIASQVFSKAWDRMKKGIKINNVSAYLFQIARAEVANFYRKKANYRIISAENLPIADSSLSAELVQQTAGDIEALRMCLNKLDEDNQNVLIWRYLEDYPIKEIAKMLGKSKGAVRVMIHRALRELRGKMNIQ